MKIKSLRKLIATLLNSLILVFLSFYLPVHAVTSVPPNERLVGIAYTLWSIPAHWTENQCWGTPLTGPYDSRDRRVIRKHAKQLSDAGVDFIWIDWSNQINYDPTKVWSGGDQDLIEDATAILFDEYTKLEKHPKISIFLGVTDSTNNAQVSALTDGRLKRKADQVYRQYVANPLYRSLLQDYLGKPLLVIYTNTPTPWPNGVPPWNDERFTVRWMTGYVSEQKSLLTSESERVSKYGYWSWEDRGLQTYPVFADKPEAMVICASTRFEEGRGSRNGIPAQERQNGATFKKQWQRATDVGVQFAMVVSWNEWVKSEQPSAEVSKDIEPSKEIGDFYLKLMKEEILKFKGK